MWYSAVMSTKRSYDEACAAAHALDLVGERWALLVVRELVLGPKRFTDLRTGLPGISPNVLTQRLEELEQASIVRRRKLPPPASAWVYELTEWGLELEPAIMALGRWGARSPLKPQNTTMSLDALILSFRTMFSPEAAAGMDASLELRLGEHRYHARIADGRMELVRGSADRPDAVIETSQEMLTGVVYGGVSLADALRAGDLKVEGDKEVVQRFVALFPLPALAPVLYVPETPDRRTPA
jgi:DNA-binding HxlR family transcriptional regulator/putative sterol carrier protein